jgi:hypothetical protein
MFAVRYSIEGQVRIIRSKSAKVAIDRAVEHIRLDYLFKGVERFSISLLKDNKEIMFAERGRVFVSLYNCPDSWYWWLNSPYIPLRSL